MEPKKIIQEAIEKYKPVKVALMFSGGHDSLVSSHVSATILNEMNVPFVVYHGDTTIGIPETQQYVKGVCNKFGWELIIRKPPNKKDHYDNLVAKYGFPGRGEKSHRIMYIKLKERALRHWVTHEIKSSPHARENVLLLSGIRQQESKIRMGYSEVTRKDSNRIWSSPIFYWSQLDCENYMKQNNLPRNKVKDTICISGECLCGTFADYEEETEIRSAYPHVGKRLDKLHQTAKANGFPWPWSMGPNEWYKQHPKGQYELNFNPMCVGCENKYKK